jgi:hypothetical protein
MMTGLSRTRHMSGSATSKNRDPRTPRTYASLRFMGAKLEPDQITSILHAAPTMAYRKGEPYKRSGHNIARGRTGLWLLSSEKTVHSSDLNDHLAYLILILFPDNSGERLEQIHKLMRAGDVEADVGCFWLGNSGTQRPVISRSIKDAFRKVPASIEKDFHITEDDQKPIVGRMRA